MYRARCLRGLVDNTGVRHLQAPGHVMGLGHGGGASILRDATRGLSPSLMGDASKTRCRCPGDAV